MVCCKLDHGWFSQPETSIERRFPSHVWWHQKDKFWMVWRFLWSPKCLTKATWIDWHYKGLVSKFRHGKSSENSMQDGPVLRTDLIHFNSKFMCFFFPFFWFYGNGSGHFQMLHGHKIHWNPSHLSLIFPCRSISKFTAEVFKCRSPEECPGGTPGGCAGRWAERPLWDASPYPLVI